jgi:hypothetical protein
MPSVTARVSSVLLMSVPRESAACSGREPLTAWSSCDCRDRRRRPSGPGRHAMKSRGSRLRAGWIRRRWRKRAGWAQAPAERGGAVASFASLDTLFSQVVVEEEIRAEGPKDATARLARGAWAQPARLPPALIQPARNGLPATSSRDARAEAPSRSTVAGGPRVRGREQAALRAAPTEKTEETRAVTEGMWTASRHALVTRRVLRGRVGWTRQPGCGTKRRGRSGEWQKPSRRRSAKGLRWTGRGLHGEYGCAWARRHARGRVHGHRATGGEMHMASGR